MLAKSGLSARLWKQNIAALKPFMPIVIALLLGIATTAGAITAVKRIRSADYGFQPPRQMEHLGGAALREVLW